MPGFCSVQQMALSNWWAVGSKIHCSEPMTTQKWRPISSPRQYPLGDPGIPSWTSPIPPMQPTTNGSRSGSFTPSARSRCAQKGAASDAVADGARLPAGLGSESEDGRQVVGADALLDDAGRVFAIVSVDELGVPRVGDDRLVHAC
jgi:hypothetical protein